MRARLPNREKPNPSMANIAILFTPSFEQHSIPHAGSLCAGVVTRCPKRLWSMNPYPTPRNTDCSTMDSIRYVTKNLYVGHFRERMAGHRTAYRNVPLYRHYRKKDHSLNDCRVQLPQPGPIAKTRKSGSRNSSQGSKRFEFNLQCVWPHPILPNSALKLQ